MNNINHSWYIDSLAPDLNSSSGSYSNGGLCDGSDSTLFIFLAVIVSFLAAGTLVSNIILIAAVVRTSYLHTKTNALLVSVAASEILLALFVMPIVAALMFKKTLRVPVTFCELVGFMFSLSRSSKSLGILSVSVDRCIAISHPLQYSRIITKTTTVVFISTVWGVSFLFAILPLFGVGKFTFLSNYGRCIVDMDAAHTFSMVKEVVCTIAPSVAITVALVIIIAEARAHHRITTIAQLAITLYSSAAAFPGVNYARSTFRAMRTFLVVTLIYLCTCFPFSLHVVITSGNKTRSCSSFIVFSFFKFICSLSTPLVITTLNIKFRQSIRMILVSRNKVRPVDIEPYTISTGLHSVLEASLVFKYVSNKDNMLRRHKSNEQIPGPSRMTPKVRFESRKVSVLNEVQSSSSSDHTFVGPTKLGHPPLRKTLSSPS